MNKRFAQFLVLGIHFTLDIRGGAKVVVSRHAHVFLGFISTSKGRGGMEG